MSDDTEPKHPHVVLLDRIVAAALAGDATDLFDIYAPDAVIWHNHDLKETTVAENAQLLEAMDGWVKNRSYDERRIQVFEDGAMQQHVLRGTRAGDGEPVELHACAVITVRDGKVTRLDEYLDSREAARLRP